MKLSEMNVLTVSTIAERKNRNKGMEQKFKAALNQHGTSQDELADNVDVDKSTISRYKHGVRQPSLDTLKAMAKQGMNVDELFIRSGGTAKSKKKVNAQRSKKGSSRVSANMLKASREAQKEEGTTNKSK